MSKKAKAFVRKVKEKKAEEKIYWALYDEGACMWLCDDVGGSTDLGNAGLFATKDKAMIRRDVDSDCKHHKPIRVKVIGNSRSAWTATIHHTSGPMLAKASVVTQKRKATDKGTNYWALQDSKTKRWVSDDVGTGSRSLDKAVLFKTSNQACEERYRVSDYKTYNVVRLRVIDGYRFYEQIEEESSVVTQKKKATQKKSGWAIYNLRTGAFVLESDAATNNQASARLFNTIEEAEDYWALWIWRERGFNHLLKMDRLTSKRLEGEGSMRQISPDRYPDRRKAKKKEKEFDTEKALIGLLGALEEDSEITDFEVWLNSWRPEVSSWWKSKKKILEDQKETAKKAALAKLTKEEQELLGLAKEELGEP